MRAPRILGVDFSGAGDAGRRIWIAEGAPSAGGFRLAELRPATELKGGGRSPSLAIAALAAHIIETPATVAGLDFPFSIPRSLIAERSWVDFIAAFPARFPDPDAFREWAFRSAGGRELRRSADLAAKTPFNSYNLRIYRQTWWGVTALLHPLVRANAAVVRPYQPMPSRPKPILIEACPACGLKSLGFYPPYKGRTATHREARAAVLRRLIDAGVIARPDRALSARMIEDSGGDALDAVVAAAATAQADVALDADHGALIEGRIYGELRRPRTAKLR